MLSFFLQLQPGGLRLLSDVEVGYRLQVVAPRIDERRLSDSSEVGTAFHLNPATADSGRRPVQFQRVRIAKFGRSAVLPSLAKESFDWLPRSHSLSRRWYVNMTMGW